MKPKRKTRYKLTLKDCQKSAEEKGGTCLSLEYRGDRAHPMRWRCAEGHEWDVVYHSIRNGNWCKICTNDVHSIQECHEAARERGGECLSTSYKNNYTHMKWRCEYGHEWETCFKHILKGTWCPVEGAGIDSMEDLHAKAAEYYGICLSEDYIGVMHKYKWRCFEGHEWTALWKNVKKEAWCIKCANKSRMLTVEDCQRLATKRGGWFLSKEYKGCNEFYDWQCVKGHQWRTKYITVYLNHWCPHCGHDSRAAYSLEDVQKMAKERGGEFLDDNYRITTERHNFRCAQGHEWLTTLNIILMGSWCPHCRLSKNEEKVRKVLEAMNLEFTTQKTFDGCKSLEDRHLKFDFYLPEINVLVEADGNQHFELVNYFQGMFGFQKRIHHDSMKGLFCLENGITLIRVAHNEDIQQVLNERLQHSSNEKFVMFPMIDKRYEGQVEALFGDKRYETVLL